MKLLAAAVAGIALSAGGCLHHLDTPVTSVTSTAASKARLGVRPKPPPPAGPLYRVVFDDRGEVREVRKASGELVHLNDMSCPDMPPDLRQFAEKVPPPMYDGTRKSAEMMEKYSDVASLHLSTIVTLYDLCARKRH